MLFAGTLAWTPEGLPAKKTPTIKSANRCSESQISWL